MKFLKSYRSLRKKTRYVCLGETKASYSHKTSFLRFTRPAYVVLVIPVSKIVFLVFTSNKEAKNKPGLCPVKGKFNGLYSLGKARNLFPRMSAIKKPFPCSTNRATLETESPFPEVMVHSFIHDSHSHQLELYHETGKKHRVTVHEAPHRCEDYIQLGAACFPKCIV